MMSEGHMKKEAEVEANKMVGETPSTLFVTDSKGNILISNEFTALTIGIPLEELLTYNVQDLVREGYYNHSITMQAIQTKQKVSQPVKTIQGFDVFSTAVPILDKRGEVQLVITSSHDYCGRSLILQTDRRAISSASRSKSRAEYKAPGKETGIVAESLAMKQIIQVCNQIASYDSKVLITGESGTGKEVIAKYIHQRSHKWNGPFISINCAAIPASLFEYELFGYEKGAIAGATEEKKGMFEIASGGVLFLDEIAEMPLEMQAKLLRVLENNEFRRVGGVSQISVNCRVICATNRDLWSAVNKGLFREDLYYRINVIPIHIPPLRNRRADLVGLTSSFITYFNQIYRKKYALNADDFQQILDHPWHGNARELKNHVERLVITDKYTTATPLAEDNIEDWFSLDHFINKNGEKFANLKDFVALVEGRYIQMIMKACGGNCTEAAKQLNIDRSGVFRKLKKMKELLNEE